MPSEDELAQRRDHHKREHDDREREQDIDEALDPVVDLAAEIGRRDAEHRPDGRAEERGREADNERRARAVDDAREDVAPVGIRAGPVVPRRGAKDAGEIDVERIIGRDILGEDTREHHQEDDHEARGAERLLAHELEDRATPARQDGSGGEGCDGHQVYRMRGSNTA